MHYFNVGLFRISLLIMHCFNVPVVDVALFELALFIALFTVPLFNVAPC